MIYRKSCLQIVLYISSEEPNQNLGLRVFNERHVRICDIKTIVVRSSPTTLFTKSPFTCNYAFRKACFISKYFESLNLINLNFLMKIRLNSNNYFWPIVYFCNLQINRLIFHYRIFGKDLKMSYLHLQRLICLIPKLSSLI